MKRHVPVLAAILMGASAALAAENEFQIQASNVDAYPVGQKLAKGDSIDVPKDGKIALIDRTGGTLRQWDCAGPYTGAVQECDRSAKRAPSPVQMPGGTRGE